ncbi:NADPH:quinone oxidoreductase family protein [Henriciella sp.]|uniref:NADPH:quinone oxidoreductase family protein n=1 Tax=Henriciella sp. TaxID=1968823 RepID=UPI002607FC85|nr:NADPH:quinone oxidoreductase family protein [Henriciella sp.]
MKALLSKSAGGPETLELQDVPNPQAGEGEVVIDVKAIGVNYPDVLIIQDQYQFKPERPFAPGGEISGVVKSVGSGVTKVKKGDRVMGSIGWGGMAEEVVVDEARVRPFPESMSFEEGAALLMTYGTSYYALKDRGQCKQGESLLVLGAAGGVGLAAVELGAAMGMDVIAAASSEEKVELAKQKGASKGLVYPRGPLEKADQKALSDKIKELGGGGVDVIYDGVGGDYAEPALRAMNWDGRFLVIGFPAGIPKMPLNLTLLKSCNIVGVFWGAAVARDPKANEQNIKEIFELYEQGKIKPHISNTYPLDKGPDAITELMERRAQGKVVVTV